MFRIYSSNCSNCSRHYCFPIIRDTCGDLTINKLLFSLNVYVITCGPLWNVKRFNFITFRCGPFHKAMCLMCAEKLDDLRGDLLPRIKVDQVLLAHMMKNSVISRSKKAEILKVCSSIINVIVVSS